MKSMISVWYKKGMNKYLSGLGFTHFATHQSMDDDFKDGKAYMINTEKLTFGLKDMIHMDDFDRAGELCSEFEATGKIGFLGDLLQEGVGNERLVHKQNDKQS